MRDTKYATELATANLDVGDGHETKKEKIFVKELSQEEIRFSWWSKGKFMRQALDLPEEDLLKLFQLAIDEKVFTESFLQRLKNILP